MMTVLYHTMLLLLLLLLLVFFGFLIALGTRFPRAEKLANCVKKKIKLYSVLQCASIGVLSQIV